MWTKPNSSIFVWRGLVMEINLQARRSEKYSSSFLLYFVIKWQVTLNGCFFGTFSIMIWCSRVTQYSFMHPYSSTWTPTNQKVCIYHRAGHVTKLNCIKVSHVPHKKILPFPHIIVIILWSWKKPCRLRKFVNPGTICPVVPFSPSHLEPFHSLVY